MTPSHPPESASLAAVNAPAQEPCSACVMVFNASDPSGAGGLTADISTIASVGGHPVAVVTGAYARDTSAIFDHFSLDDEAVQEQARAALEDLPVRAIKVGFVGSPANISAIAGLSADYPGVPVVSYMPDLSWWQDDRIDQYLDAFGELLLPQTTVLVGNYSTLGRWLLPAWSADKKPTARDIAAAAAEKGVPYTLVTGIALPEQFIDNVLASPTTVLCSGRFESFDATFMGAGDTLSAALTALLACGMDLVQVCTEALDYLDLCLESGFRPGMGHILPDRMFWAVPEDADTSTPSGDAADVPSIDGFVFPPHDTQH